jgi:hypothetical protein
VRRNDHHRAVRAQRQKIPVDAGVFPTGVANQAAAMNKAEKICGAALSPSVFLTLCKIY